MQYATRRLSALKEFPHADRLLRTGDVFECTPIDADYYLTRKMAAEASAPAPAAAAPAAIAEAVSTTAPIEEPAPAAAEQVAAVAEEPEAPPLTAPAHRRTPTRRAR